MFRNTRDNQRGIVLIWTLLFFLVLIGLVGLAVDTAYVRTIAHQLQNAADAAALAGALNLKPNVDDVQAACTSVALANSAAGAPVLLVENAGNDSAGDIVIGVYERATQQFVPTLVEPNAVKVVARRTSDSPAGAASLFFGPIFGVNTTNVARMAIAMLAGARGVIALDWQAPNALYMNGDAFLATPEQGIQVNSGHNNAVRCNGTPTIETPYLNVTGDARAGGLNLDGVLNTGAPRWPDPLANLPSPPWDAGDDKGAITGGTGQPIEPGYYSKGISANGGTIHLQPGIYVLDGAGLSLSGNASLVADGVMLYIKGKGKLDLGGTGEIHLTPPDKDIYSYAGVDTYHGVVIFQDRANNAGARIIGTSLMDLHGIIYLPEAHIELGGTGDAYGNALISNTIEVKGTGDITIPYDERYSLRGGSSFLVR